MHLYKFICKARLPAWSYNLDMHTFFFSAEFTTPESLCKSLLKLDRVDSSAFQATGHQRYNYGRLITQKPFYHYDSKGDFKLSQKDCPPCTSLAWGIQRPPCGGLRLGTCVLHQVNGVEIASQWCVKVVRCGKLVPGLPVQKCVLILQWLETEVWVSLDQVGILTPKQKDWNIICIIDVPPKQRTAPVSVLALEFRAELTFAAPACSVTCHFAPIRHRHLPIWKRRRAWTCPTCKYNDTFNIQYAYGC